MLGLLLQRPGQTVTEVAEQLGLSLPLASQYLRALEARGLLVVERTGRKAKYRIPRAGGDSDASRLIQALSLTFKREPSPEETVFRLATAFTHPRRVEILRVLQEKPCRVGQIQAAVSISERALSRHLTKLEARGFVAHHLGVYSAATHPMRIGRELAELAVR